MSNLFARAQAMLIRRLTRAASPAGSVVYTPVSGVALNLTGACWVGRTVYSRSPQDNGPAVVFGERDYLVPVAALPAPPARGDRFTESINGVDVVFEVIAELGEPEYRYADPGRTIYRIHCKQVEVD